MSNYFGHEAEGLMEKINTASSLSIRKVVGTYPGRKMMIFLLSTSPKEYELLWTW